jgi:hypothetical protein
MFGIDKIFGKAKLPRLSPVEQYFRRKIAPEATKVVKPLGNVVRDTITRPLTDALGAVADDLGLSTTGRDSRYMADAKFQLGNSDDRSTVPTNVENLSLVDIKPEAVRPSEPEGSATTNGTKGDAIDSKIKSNGKTLKDIKTPEHLLFWSMMVGNDIDFSIYDRKKENVYYSEKNKQNTMNFINKLTSSSWVNKINPNIRGMKNQAMSLLNDKTNKKQAMNKLHIVNRLYKLAQMFDEMNMPEQADDVTNVMENISDSPEKTAWTNYARKLAKKDPDFIPPVKPKVSAITFLDVTETALSVYHLYKNNKKELPKLSSMEENQLKQLAKNADRTR